MHGSLRCADVFKHSSQCEAASGGAGGHHHGHYHGLGHAHAHGGHGDFLDRERPSLCFLVAAVPSLMAALAVAACALSCVFGCHLAATLLPALVVATCAPASVPAACRLSLIRLPLVAAVVTHSERRGRRLWRGR